MREYGLNLGNNNLVKGSFVGYRYWIWWFLVLIVILDFFYNIIDFRVES